MRAVRITATTILLTGALTAPWADAAVAKMWRSGPPSCAGSTVWRVSARGSAGCMAHRGAWTQTTWSGGKVRHVMVWFTVKDTVRDGHCAYGHYRTRSRQTWRHAVVKACGVGHTARRKLEFEAGPWSTQVVRYRVHEGHGGWSATRVYSLRGV